MSGFLWLDAERRQHALTSCEPIEAELGRVTASLKQFAADLTSDVETTWRAAMTASEPLVARRNTLIADLRRWNDHADAGADMACAALREDIARLVIEAGFVERLHGCYQEWEDRLRLGSDDGAASDRQHAFITEAAEKLGIAAPAITTFRQAHGWLMRQPATNRVAFPAGLPAFVWTDRHGHAHQSRSLIPIEAELLALVRELADMIDDLQPHAPLSTRLLALERASTREKQIQIIQQQQEGWERHVTGIERDAARRRSREIEDL